ncbi:sensor histidine kinase [Nonomuraea sp. ATR24]|uniref:sensor histidine kinase n=2 Tax=unclassified Nonomuraea TaxID=2593643 RepID=UPI0035BFD7BF
MFRYRAGRRVPGHQETPPPPSPPPRDPARTAAVAVAAAAGLAALAATGLDLAAGPAVRPEPIDWPVWSSTVPGVALAAAGFVLATRLPRHLMTWLLLGGGAVSGLNALGAAYAVLSLHAHGGRLPLTAAALFAGARLGPLLNLVTPLVLLYFPDGRLPSPRWRAAAWLTLGSAGLAALLFMTVPWRLMSAGPGWPGVDAPLPPLPDAVWTALLPAAPLLLVVSTAVPALAFVSRFRGSRGVLRAQLRWMALAALLNGALILLPLALRGLPQDLAFVLSLLAVAGAVLVAVGRYRLYDIDPLLGWTLLYGGLAVAVVAIDVPIFVGLGALIDEPVAAVLAASAVALVYAPLRERARRWVSRVLTGRAEPYEVVSVLARRLEEATGPERPLLEPLLETARAVCAAYGSPYARVELDQADGGTLVAEHGTPGGATVVLPIGYRGEPIGRLSLTPRGRLAEADERLLADVVRQTAAAVRAIALSEELQESRARLVSGVAEERRRLRRDLHDGLGPALAAAALKVEAAGNLMERDPAAARQALGQVRADLGAVIGDVRRLVHDLRPPALDQWGLAGALRKEAARFSDGGLAVRVEVRGELDGLPAATEVAAYRIVCEALVNVARHAAARTCEVRLTRTGGELEVEVADDGRGVEPQAAPGVGLIAMRERARELGGRCSVALRAGGGTLVRAVLPSGGVA